MSEIDTAVYAYMRHRRRSRHLSVPDRPWGEELLADYAMTALTCLAMWQEEPQLLWRESGKLALDRAVERFRLPGGAFAAKPGRQTVDAAVNSLMIAALARGGQALQEPKYLRMAHTARIFLKTRLTDEQGRLHRSWGSWEADREGTAEDYGLYVLALMELYRATGSRFYRREAMHLADQMAVRFLPPEGTGTNREITS